MTLHQIASIALAVVALVIALALLSVNEPRKDR